MSSSSLSSRRILARPGLEPTRGRGTIKIADGTIEGVTFDREGSDASAGGPDILAMPALGNGHDHGRGVKFLSFGLKDDTLEAWVPAFYARPDVDPYLNAALIMARFARSGIASAVHCHTMPRGDDLESEIAAVVRAARDVGIRIGLVVPMRDRNRFCYGADESLLSMLNPADRPEVARNWGYASRPPREQVARVEELGRRYDSELVQVQFGPIGVQWASDELLELIAEASARSGRRVHMHFLESRYQREWMDATYHEGVVSFLDRIGLLSPRLTLAHGVWLKPEEMDVLAAREVIVSLNTSSNLRLGSGIAPAREMLARGVPLALGLDGLAFDDDDDALREMRLADVLHRGPGFAEGIARHALFDASMAIAPLAATGLRNHGQLTPGMAADIVTLDYAAMSGDVIEGMLDESDLVLARGTAHHVVSLIVAGREVVRDGEVVGVDVRAIATEVTAQIKAQKNTLVSQRRIVETYQGALRRYYASRQHVCGCGADVSRSGRS
jgi:cytosine/adenosine deaminase-related metal-dependent hydrolase